jgi:hypothetical protein
MPKPKFEDLSISRYGPPKFTASRPISKLQMVVTFLIFKDIDVIKHSCSKCHVLEKNLL